MGPHSARDELERTSICRKEVLICLDRLVTSPVATDVETNLLFALCRKLNVTPQNSLAGEMLEVWGYVVVICSVSSFYFGMRKAYLYAILRCCFRGLCFA